METLLELVDVRDPRGGGGRRKHVFKEILAIAILAKLSGAQTFNLKRAVEPSRMKL